MKKKKVIIISSVVAVILVAALVLGLVLGNNNKKPDDSTKVVPQARYQVDERSAAYKAYKADGTEIGTYKTVAAAINAAVETDSFGSDNSVTEYGSYVEFNGVTIFQNRNGFAEASDDQFWFYTNGTQLEAYDCYDSVMYADYLKNNKVITHEVTARGSTVKQYHNGYALYNANGTLDTADKAAQSWELSSTMDAAVLGIPARLKGISGLNHEIDLTNVQIKPNYQGTDDTYAYIGYYAWQDYYVIATGIACNVATGAWYPFEGTSRDDSFSDVEYNLGDTPLMVSTWNEEGGYWTPEYATLKMSIRTVSKTDELGDYYVDESVYEFYTEDGELDNKYEVTIDEEMINKHFASTAYGPENTFVFIAGLDIRTPTSAGVYSYATDYTNGAEFKNLRVVKATAHIPTEEELPTLDYGYSINSAWRGNDYNILLSSGEHEDGVYDYTILNTYACAEYTNDNGADLYSFSYNKANSATTALGGKAAEYQAKIDQLKSATTDNVSEMEDLINEVAAMYGTDGTAETSNLAQKFYMVLDFAPLQYAQDLFAQVATLTEAGENFVSGVKALPSLLDYAYVGWKTDEAEDTGYLMNDVADFKAIYDQYYAQLTQNDLNSLKYHLNETNLEMYIDLMNKAEDYFAVGFKVNAKEYGSSTDFKDYTGEDMYADIAFYLNKIHNGTKWGGEEPENDDPNDGGATQLNSDNNWMPAYHVLYLKARLEEAGYKLPLYMSNLMTLCGEADGFTEDFNYLDTVLTLAAGIEKGTIVVVNEKVATMVNTYMVDKKEFKEDGLAWNFNNSNQVDFTYRSKAYKSYYGLDKDTNLSVYIETVQTFLATRVSAEADGIGIKAEVSVQTVQVSTEAAAVMALFDKNAIHGAAFDAYNAAIAEYNKLSAEDQAIVAQLSAYEDIVEMMEGHKNALQAVDLDGVEDVTVYENIYYTRTTDTKEMSVQDALYQLNDLICRVQAVAKFSYEDGESDNATADSCYAVMNFDNIAFPSIRIVVLRQYFEKANVKLPAYFTEIYTQIGYDAFYTSYQAIYETVRLTATYAKEGKTVADMTDDDKASFEKYWGGTYDVSKDDFLKWNWNSGEKFETYFSTRVAGIALQYYLESGEIIEERFDEPKTVTWIYGDRMAEYEYKGVKYIAHAYQDEAEALNRTYGSLIKDYWDATPIYIDADGNICTAETEGATMLMTSTPGVTKTDKADWAENCAELATKQYITADGQIVYKRYVWRSKENGGAYIDYDATDFVDEYNRTVDLSEEEIANITVVRVVKVYKYFDEMAAWLTAQGYTVNSNGWGYSQAPQA